MSHQIYQYQNSWLNSRDTHYIEGTAIPTLGNDCVVGFNNKNNYQT